MANKSALLYAPTVCRSFTSIRGGNMRKIAVLAGLLLSLSTGIALAKDATKADNSEQNKGSTRKDAVTAEKQGNRKSDVEALAEIRKTIVGTDGLSMDAKNAKILYSKGRV